jgi:two-component system, cell cycle response regulator CtrA
MTAQSIQSMLNAEKYTVEAAKNLDEATELAKIYDYGLILTSNNFPDGSALDLIRFLRNSRVETPIIVLTNDSNIDQGVMLLGRGADDVIQKPFFKDDLIARMNTVIRRSKGHAESRITTGNIVVNLDKKMVEVNGAYVHLTEKEYLILQLLALRKGTIITKESLLNHLYGGRDEPAIKIIDVFICKLRQKLARANNGINHIETVWGRGYVLRNSKFEKANKPETSARPDHSSTTEVMKEAEQLRSERVRIFEELGLSPNSSLEDFFAKMNEMRLRQEALLRDSEAGRSAGQIIESLAGTNVTTYDPRGHFNQETVVARYEAGLRQPIGMVFKIGNLIEVDTSILQMGNVQTGHAVEISPVVGTLLEVITFYQGSLFNKESLKNYIFENYSGMTEPQKIKCGARVGQFITQAQGYLTQLVGRELAGMLIHVGTGGNYGMPHMSNLLPSPNAPTEGPA